MHILRDNVTHMLAAANGNADSEFDLTLFDILHFFFDFVSFIFICAVSFFFHLFFLVKRFSAYFGIWMNGGKNWRTNRKLIISTRLRIRQ